MKAKRGTRRSRRNGSYESNGFHLIEQPEDKPVKRLNPGMNLNLIILNLFITIP